MWRIPSDVSQFKSSVSRGFWTEFFSYSPVPSLFLCLPHLTRFFAISASCRCFRCDRVTTTGMKESRRFKNAQFRRFTTIHPCTPPQHGSLIISIQNREDPGEFYNFLNNYRNAINMVIAHWP